MKHEIKLIIEFDGIKVEKTVPCGNLYKAVQTPPCFGIAAEDDCAYIMHDHILHHLLEEGEHARYYGHEQNIPHFRKLREMCKDLCVKVKDKLRSL